MDPSSTKQVLRWLLAVGITIAAIGFELALVAAIVDKPAPGRESWETLTATDWVRALSWSAGIGGFMLALGSLIGLVGAHLRNGSANPNG